MIVAQSMSDNLSNLKVESLIGQKRQENRQEQAALSDYTDVTMDQMRCRFLACALLSACSLSY